MGSKSPLQSLFDPGALAARALRALDPEDAHALAHRALHLGLGPKAPQPHPALHVTIAGLELPTPIGLAAGFDKNAELIEPLLDLGFGFIECGTVTPRPQPGNPRPRLFRLSEDRAIVNRMGFNNHGVDPFARRLAARSREGVVGANVGANKDSDDRIADYVLGVARVYPFADYVAVNVSSPNTPGLRDLQSGAALEELLGRAAETRLGLQRAHGRKPLFLKIAPDLDERAALALAETAIKADVDALIVSNTTVARPSSLRSRSRAETGGLSGRPLFEPSTRLLRALATALRGRLPLIGVGGVEDAPCALAKIKAGATAVQLYSAMIYEGPGLPAHINAQLAQRLAAEGFRSVGEAIGADLR